MHRPRGAFQRKHRFEARGCDTRGAGAALPCLWCVERAAVDRIIGYNLPCRGCPKRVNVWGEGVVVVYRGTFAVVDCAAIQQNCASIKSLLAPDTRLMLAVKANGYGHGALQAARAGIAGGVTDLGVATVEEALALRDAGVETPILVLGATSAQGAVAAAERNISITIGNADTDSLEQVLPQPGTLRHPLTVHLKVDTGMSRLGARSPAAAVRMAQALQARDDVVLEGMFTHLACADDPDLRHASQQTSQFSAVKRALADVGIRPRTVHAANSAAALRMPEWHFDMVRVGIAAYGYGPADTYASPVPLHSALHLYSTIVRVATLQAGETVGYGATFTAHRPTRVATVPVGYADGYFRVLSNRASLMLRGKRAPVVGNICMDQLVIDVTDIPTAEVGDCVTLYGRAAGPAFKQALDNQGDGAAALSERLQAAFEASAGEQVLSLDEVAGLAGTISYEVMCALSTRVPRIYVG